MVVFPGVLSFLQSIVEAFNWLNTSCFFDSVVIMYCFLEFYFINKKENSLFVFVSCGLLYKQSKRSAVELLFLSF